VPGFEVGMSDCEAGAVVPAGLTIERTKVSYRKHVPKIESPGRTGTTARTLSTTLLPREVSEIPDLKFSSTGCSEDGGIRSEGK
jgi:hypothetical protein